MLPAGSGLSVVRLICVAVKAPWPKPVLTHELLAPLVKPVARSVVPSRLLAVEPTAGLQAGSIEVYERLGLGALRAHFLNAGASATSEIVRAIADTRLGSLGDVQTDRVRSLGVEELDRPVLAICAQGSHDQCCGVFGQELVETVDRLNLDVSTRTVSHLGGHRFAPTLMALPSGRMWGFVGGGLVRRIVDGSVTEHDLLTKCRGWWGCGGGRAQAAEIAARCAYGQRFREPVTVIRSTELEEGNEEVFSVTSGYWQATVGVGVRRQVPTVKCGTAREEFLRFYDEFATRIIKVDNGEG